MIDNFNDAHKDKGVQIKMEVVPEEQYVTKVLAAAATGKAPGLRLGHRRQARADGPSDGVIVPLDDLAKQVGPRSRRLQRVLDAVVALSEIRQQDLHDPDGPDEPAARGQSRPRQGGRARPDKFPTDGDTLLEWAKAMTKRDGDKVTRSGIMMTGSGVQPTVTWGIVAEQMGFQRASDDLKTACVNPEAGKAAMQWVLDLFDKHKVSTRDVTDRYKAFGTGQGSIFWTGPWTLNGYVEQKLNFAHLPVPQDRRGRS